MPAPRESSASALSATPEVARVSLDRTPPYRLRTHARSVVVLLVLAIVVTGFVYPWVVTGIAQLATPHTANGSLLYQNGTIVGSSLIGQNLSRPNLFWDRPSPSDYNTTVGAVTTLPGPSDPALLAYLNETTAYMRAEWNWSVNTTVPFDLVSPSYTGFDPYVAPAGVLIQVSRVAGAIHNATNASFDALVGALTNLVNQYIEPALGGVVGVPVVNVLTLDLALIESPWWG